MLYILLSIKWWKHFTYFSLPLFTWNILFCKNKSNLKIPVVLKGQLFSVFQKAWNIHLPVIWPCKEMKIFLLFPLGFSQAFLSQPVISCWSNIQTYVINKNVRRISHDYLSCGLENHSKYEVHGAKIIKVVSLLIAFVFLLVILVFEKQQQQILEIPELG